MTQLYLIRHGRTAWNNADRLQGWADEPLDAVGQAQAAALAEYLRGTTFSAIYSSPLLRASQTAAALAKVHALRVNLDLRLRERNVGEWTGLTIEQARAQAPDAFDGADWRQAGAPGGDSQAALTERAAAAVEDILAAHPESLVAVVSHGGALSAVLAYLLGIPSHRAVSFSFHNTAFARVSVRPGGAGGRTVRLIALGEGPAVKDEGRMTN
jgi:broad specificity phosphatase PhoE